MLLVVFAIGLLFAAHFRIIDSYIQIVAMTIGINIMMSTSLNLVNGNMGEFTCGHCQLVCHPDKEVRQKRYKMLTEGGVVIQHPDGSLQAVSPEEAKKHLAAMTPDMRALYE